MKQLVFAIIGSLIVATSDAQIKTPAASTSQTVKQDFGLATVELSYARPNVKGRKIFGDIVPYDAVWRTGANSATVLNFGDDVIIGGTAVPAGKYGLLSIPGKKQWTLIISKQTDVTNPTAYDQSKDVVRIPVDVKKNSKVETFTIQFANVAASTMDLQILWDKSMVTLPISTEIDSKIMASIEKNLKTDKPQYFQAAMYYMESGKDLNQALEYFNKAVEQNPKAYWIQYNWANCLAKLGKTNEARAAAEKSKELAIEGKNNDYVRLNEKLLKSLGK
ncbi:DUF2911 domain-containing protein [Terrimonas rubra]|uniref:DUF2911 domain-containing protein n=1 Tax=Terrimonas rubra TaxID=1035890 RepID=A0ABW6A4W4_9BACT